MKFIFLFLIVVLLLPPNACFASIQQRESLITLDVLSLMEIIGGVTCMIYGFSETSHTETSIERVPLYDLVTDAGTVLPETYVSTEKQSTIIEPRDKTIGWIGVGLVVCGITTRVISKKIKVNSSPDYIGISFNQKW